MEMSLPFHPLCGKLLINVLNGFLVKYNNDRGWEMGDGRCPDLFFNEKLGEISLIIPSALRLTHRWEGDVAGET